MIRDHRGDPSNCIRDQEARMNQLKQQQGPMKNTSIYALEYVDKIRGWHHDRNLIDGSTDKDQFCKLIQEAGELSDSICKGKDVSDDIGDMMVVLINVK